MGLKEIFQKQGGVGLLKQYCQSGALFTAVAEFILLGKKKKALEILRLTAEYKTKENLEKKYKSEIVRWEKHYCEKVIQESSNKVWVCWFQGIEQAPDLVKKCYQSLQQNLTDREIILITEKNMCDYVEFPDFILEKWKKGQITYTHMTDLLRLELLIRYGGMWIDATVFCTEKRETIPDYYFNSELFFYQELKPGRDGHSEFVSSWLISAKSNNKILMMTRDLCYTYWKTHDSLINYFLFHDFFCIALEHHPKEWNQIVPRDNGTPHILLLRLFEKYDEQLWQAVRAQAPFHKLSYKFDEEQEKKKGTFYWKLFVRGEAE